MLLASAPGSAAFAPAAYINSGYWSIRASSEAKRAGRCNVVWDGTQSGFRELPSFEQFAVAPNAAYLHHISNETVEGLQLSVPNERPEVPLIADMSSDFLSKPLAAERFGMIYAHAQKNLGPAGVTVALIDRDLLARVPDGLPRILDLRTHVEHRSNYNTPPVFAIYVLMLVTRWLRDTIGGLAAMQAINDAKSLRLYHTLDKMRGTISVHAMTPWRSQMNVAFTFGDARLDRAFIAFAGERGIVGLDGHRSIGGLRASLTTRSRWKLSRHSAPR